MNGLTAVRGGATGPGQTKAAGLKPSRADGAAMVTDMDATARDALHIVPLGLLPLETPALGMGRLVKTATLGSQVDLSVGQAQGPLVSLDDVPDVLGITSKGIARDLKTLAAVSRIASFDVYSLRIELRSLGIAVESMEQLRLSPGKKQELSVRMGSFVRPLLEQVFGAGPNDMADLDRLMTTVDRAAVMDNLRSLGSRVGLPLAEVPVFLESYADIFTSVAYFHSCNDGLRANLADFTAWIGGLDRSGALSADPAAARMVADVVQGILGLTRHLDNCFASLDRRCQMFWDTLEAERFQDAFAMIEAHHTALGAILCGLAVKMAAWQQAFPTAEGTPAERLTWLRETMQPGLRGLGETASLSMMSITRLLN